MCVNVNLRCESGSIWGRQSVVGVNKSGQHVWHSGPAVLHWLTAPEAMEQIQALPPNPPLWLSFLFSNVAAACPACSTFCSTSYNYMLFFTSGSLHASVKKQGVRTVMVVTLLCTVQGWNECTQRRRKNRLSSEMHFSFICFGVGGK